MSKGTTKSACSTPGISFLGYRTSRIPRSPRKEGTNAVINLDKQLGNVQQIQDKYDSDTNNGHIPSMQTAWIAALSNARITFVRPSLRVALANAGLFR